MAYEFCEDSAKQNVVYAELRFSPYLDASHCLGEEYCEGVFAGLERGQKDFGIKVRVILVFMRDAPGELLVGVATQERCPHYRGALTREVLTIETRDGPTRGIPTLERCS